MRRLYFKIFLWFWLGVVVVSLTLWAAAALTYSRAEDDRRWQEKYGPRIDLWCRQEIDILESSGLPALTTYLESFEYDPGVVNYVFDAGGHELLNRQASPEVLRIVREAAGHPGQHADPTERIIAETSADTRGRLFTVVIDQPAPTMLNRSLFEFLFAAPEGSRVDTEAVLRVVAVLGVAALFCLWLAWQIAGPIDRLRFTTRAMAHELLQTRVDSKVLARRDALGDLGRDFDRMAERIETLVVAERRLLTDVTHALRSPLARLGVALTLARKDTGPETAPYLDRIEREAAAVDTLVGQLLTMARIDSGVDVPHRAPVDLRAAVQEIVADAAYEARGRNCAVTLDASDECRVNASRDLLRGAIEAVVRNAVHRAPAGSAVEISVRANSAPRAAAAVISVRDRGPDVPREALERLFMPFNQGPNDIVTERLDGAGLDLAIAKRSLELFAGKIAAANAADGGLLVTMTLPLA